jgi:hypothetical protein
VLPALLWCFVLALTFADGDSTEGVGFDRRLSPRSVTDQTTVQAGLRSE